MKCFRKLAAVTAMAVALGTVVFPASKSLALSDVHIDSSTFPDQTFRDFVSDSFDTVKDGYLSPSERSNVTTLFCYDMNIADLTGITYFSNLQALYCGGNRLTTIDLSSCPNLYIVSCIENDITVLDLSNTYLGQHFGECRLDQSGGCNTYFCDSCRLSVDYGVTIRINGRDYCDEAPEGTVNMYRLYNTNSGEHFYTANANERDTLISLGWNYEGIGWTAPSVSESPVYRLYNENGGEHHYTMSAGERDALVAAGWNYEGIGWYSDDAQTVPLYRQYNPNAFANNHNYTTSLAENDYLVSIGWRAEAIGWYGIG